MSAQLKLITVAKKWSDQVPEESLGSIRYRIDTAFQPVPFLMGTHTIFDSITCRLWSNLLISEDEMRRVRQKQAKGEEIAFGDTTWYFNGHCVVLNRRRKDLLSKMWQQLPADTELEEAALRDENEDLAKVPPAPEEPVISFPMFCPDNVIAAQSLKEEWEEKVAARQQMIDEIVNKRKKPETILRRIGSPDGTLKEHAVAKSHFRDLKKILLGIRGSLQRQSDKNIALYFE